MRRLFLAASLLLIAVPAPARMYQWVDPETQTPQLSGTPPTWYRSAEKGPRVFVIESGTVIDDTRVAVSETVRQQLRENALVKAERDREAAREKLAAAERLKAAMAAAEEAEIEAEVPEELLLPPPPPAEDAATAPEGPTPEEMKALIDQWEKMRTEGARQVVEGTGETP